MPEPASSKDLSPASWAMAALVLCAFAGNSLLNRAALASGGIDASSFTAIRIASGAALLVALARLTGGRDSRLGGRPIGAAFLFGYAALFSWAYRSLSAATGALLLFGAVQLTMLAGAWLRRERQTPLQWVGFAVSAAGLVWLLAPGLDRPASLPAALMLAAGACWGAYSLLGFSSGSPLASTAGNFLRAVPLAVLLVVFTWRGGHLSPPGVALAIVSGAVTSGLGYALWYRLLPKLGSFRASVAQLAVPALSALAGAAILSETIGARLLLSEALVLGGVALALAAARASVGR